MNNPTDYWTIKAMQQYGGGFVKALANAAMQADASNLGKLKTAFPEYWQEYEHMGISLELRHKAEHPDD